MIGRNDTVTSQPLQEDFNWDAFAEANLVHTLEVYGEQTACMGQCSDYCRCSQISGITLDEEFSPPGLPDPTKTSRARRGSSLLRASS